MIMQYFGDIALFLERNEITPANRGKILAISNHTQRNSHLQVELSVAVVVFRRWQPLVLRFLTQT